MDWTQSLTIIISNFGVLLVLFVYLMNRMDANQKETNEKMDSTKKELEQKISSDIRELKMDMKSDMHQQIEGVNQQIKALDRRITDLKVDMNQRLSTIEGYLVPKKLYQFETPEPPHPEKQAKEN